MEALRPHHLGEAGAGLLMLMVKSRHKKPENVWRYFHPLAEANRRSHQPALAR